MKLITLISTVTNIIRLWFPFYTYCFYQPVNNFSTLKRKCRSAVSYTRPHQTVVPWLSWYEYVVDCLFRDSRCSSLSRLLFGEPPYRLRVPPSLLFNAYYPGGVMRPGCEADHPPPSSVWVKSKTWHSLPRVILWHARGPFHVYVNYRFTVK
jgi:hypothetical protein